VRRRRRLAVHGEIAAGRRVVVGVGVVRVSSGREGLHRRVVDRVVVVCTAQLFQRAMGSGKDFSNRCTQRRQRTNGGGRREIADLEWRRMP
jgi:hypothetical protein